MNTIYYISAYFLLVNIAAFTTMGIDKLKAKRHAFRVPEKILFLLAAIGGSIGAIAGMYTFRHKTKHPQFVIGMPMILVIQVVIIVLIWIYSYKVVVI